MIFSMVDEINISTYICVKAPLCRKFSSSEDILNQAFFMDVFPALEFRGFAAKLRVFFRFTISKEI